MSTVKVGVMPGRVQEFAVEGTTTFRELFAIAEVNPEGYEVKADGVKVTDFDTQVGTTQLVLLAKLVKGNVDVTVKIGVMPGRVQEFAVSTETTYNELFALAEVSPEGYEVKADGVKITDFNAQIGTVALVLLAKLVKGNADSVVKIGVMPGRVQEFAVSTETTFNELFAIAEVDPSGYEVKADGVKVTDFNAQIGSVALVLLAKLVKGNK
jgi:urease alpha subunit